MPAGVPLILEFSHWDGVTPFFEGQPEKGRRVYVVKEDSTFLAYGVIASIPQYVFQLSGTLPNELERFIAQVEREGAQVLKGPPPIETKTGGDKPPPPPSSPVGVKSDETNAPAGDKKAKSEKSSKPVSR